MKKLNNNDLFKSISGGLELRLLDGGHKSSLAEFTQKTFTYEGKPSGNFLFRTENGNTCVSVDKTKLGKFVSRAWETCYPYEPTVCYKGSAPMTFTCDE